jgi:hypothetical protein
VISSLKNAVIWDVTLCTLVGIVLHFEATCCLKTTRLHGVMSQKIVILIDNAVKSSNLTWLSVCDAWNMNYQGQIVGNVKGVSSNTTSGHTRTRQFHIECVSYLGKRTEAWNHNSCLSSAEVKNSWSCTSLPSYLPLTLRLWSTGTSLLLTCVLWEIDLCVLG